MKPQLRLDMMRRCSLLIVFLFCIDHVAWLEAAGVHTSSPIFNRDTAKNWVVLVAGSNSWYNYRHQADIFHAYQIVIGNNISAENIITFAYDDIAYNRNNPFPGKVFNDYEHRDVYKGVVIDYRREEVTPKNFLAVLRGDKELEAKGKKVLKSGPDDNVFIYFSDHGSESLIAFPQGVLYARQLNETLAYMHENRMYNKLVLYVEACYSGSMFHEILPSDIEIYVTTAANEGESSWAAFCEDMQIDTCLSDEYSHNWLTDSETHDLQAYTLEQQYKEVKKRTKQSHVMKYGEAEMGNITVGEFQGHYEKSMYLNDGSIAAADRKPASQAHLFSMSRRLMKATTEEEHKTASRKLHRALQLGHIVKETFHDIIMDVTTHYQPTVNGLSKMDELMCFEAVFDQFQTRCFTIQQVPEVAQHTSHLMELCKAGYEAETLIESVHNVCS
ncbi:hypothetical protein CRM22_009354 [Opisthorchis felineus]|uniref:Hemoglobinase n=1 Tax=Opisthorchis felineus TaxID=147828 RepID=A0A4S2L725_OPIFE|nr:hypothetical protein CRM22_009354 [Opisthorchis felineus]